TDPLLLLQRWRSLKEFETLSDLLYLDHRHRPADIGPRTISASSSSSSKASATPSRSEDISSKVRPATTARSDTNSYSANIKRKIQEHEDLQVEADEGEEGTLVLGRGVEEVAEQRWKNKVEEQDELYAEKKHEDSHEQTGDEGAAQELQQPGGDEAAQKSRDAAAGEHEDDQQLLLLREEQHED
ncbi:unnamed protein product, partial [Amoebophrya sp. A25]